MKFKSFLLFLTGILFTTNVALAYAPEVNFWKQRMSLRGSIDPRQSITTESVGATRWVAQVSNELGRGGASPLQIIPQQFGTIRQISQGSSDKTIIHIQDVHLNREAQENIAGAIQSLIDAGQVDLIALEGAFAPIDLSQLREFPHQDSVHKVADYLFRENKISGPILTAFKSKKEIPVIVGIDDKHHYDLNVEAVKESFPLKEKLKAQNLKLKINLNEQKAKVFNRELLEFYNQVQAYRNENISMGEYAVLLQEYSSPRQGGGQEGGDNQRLRLNPTPTPSPRGRGTNVSIVTPALTQDPGDAQSSSRNVLVRDPDRPLDSKNQVYTLDPGLRRGDDNPAVTPAFTRNSGDAQTSSRNVLVRDPDRPLDSKNQVYPLDPGLRRGDDNPTVIPAYTVTAVHATVIPAKAGIQLSLFTEAYNLEKSINFSKVEHERAILIKKLLAQLSSQATQHLLTMSNAFKSGNLNHADFYSYLQKLCDKNNIPLKNYPAMRDYLQYILLSDSIDGEKLQEEFGTKEKEIYDHLAKTDEEKELIQQSRQNYLKTKLLDFALTKQEWDEYVGATHRVAQVHDGFGRGTASPLQPFEDFYNEATLRDQKMAQNLQAAIEKYDAKNIVLVTGGFHSEGIKEGLVQSTGYRGSGKKLINSKNAVLSTQYAVRNTQYAVPSLISFTPKISKVDTSQGSAYLSVFTQEKTPLDKLFAGEQLFLSQHPMPHMQAVQMLLITKYHQFKSGIFELTKQFGRYSINMSVNPTTKQIRNITLTMAAIPIIDLTVHYLFGIGLIAAGAAITLFDFIFYSDKSKNRGIFQFHISRTFTLLLNAALSSFILSLIHKPSDLDDPYIIPFLGFSFIFFLSSIFTKLIKVLLHFLFIKDATKKDLDEKYVNYLDRNSPEHLEFSGPDAEAIRLRFKPVYATLKSPNENEPNLDVRIRILESNDLEKIPWSYKGVYINEFILNSENMVAIIAESNDKEAKFLGAIIIGLHPNATKIEFLATTDRNGVSLSGRKGLGSVLVAVAGKISQDFTNGSLINLYPGAPRRFLNKNSFDFYEKIGMSYDKSKFEFQGSPDWIDSFVIQTSEKYQLTNNSPVNGKNRTASKPLSISIKMPASVAILSLAGYLVFFVSGIFVGEHSAIYKFFANVLVFWGFTILLDALAQWTGGKGWNIQQFFRVALIAAPLMGLVSWVMAWFMRFTVAWSLSLSSSLPSIFTIPFYLTITSFKYIWPMVIVYVRSRLIYTPIVGKLRGNNQKRKEIMNEVFWITRLFSILRVGLVYHFLPNDFTAGDGFTTQFFSLFYYWRVNLGKFLFEDKTLRNSRLFLIFAAPFVLPLRIVKKIATGIGWILRNTPTKIELSNSKPMLNWLINMNLIELEKELQQKINDAVPDTIIGTDEETKVLLTLANDPELLSPEILRQLQKETPHLHGQPLDRLWFDLTMMNILNQIVMTKEAGDLYDQLNPDARRQLWAQILTEGIFLAHVAAIYISIQTNQALISEDSQYDFLRELKAVTEEKIKQSQTIRSLTPTFEEALIYLFSRPVANNYEPPVLDLFPLFKDIENKSAINIEEQFQDILIASKYNGHLITLFTMAIVQHLDFIMGVPVFNSPDRKMGIELLLKDNKVDFKLLNSFLPLVIERAKKGDQQALTALGWMARVFPEILYGPIPVLLQPYFEKKTLLAGQSKLMKQMARYMKKQNQNFTQFPYINYLLYTNITQLRLWRFAGEKVPSIQQLLMGQFSFARADDFFPTFLRKKHVEQFRKMVPLAEYRQAQTDRLKLFTQLSPSGTKLKPWWMFLGIFIFGVLETGLNSPWVWSGLVLATIINIQNPEKGTLEYLVGKSPLWPTYHKIFTSLGNFPRGTSIQYIPNTPGAGYIPFSLNQDGLLFFNEFLEDHVTYSKAYVLTYESKSLIEYHDIGLMNGLVMGILLYDGRHKKFVYLDFSGITGIEDFSTDPLIESIRHHLFPKKNKKDIQRIKLTKEGGHFFQVLDLFEIKDEGLSVFSPTDPFGEDFQTALELNKEEFNNKDVGISGAGSGIDILHALRYGARHVYANDPFFVHTILAQWNIQFAQDTNQLPKVRADQVDITKGEDFEGIEHSHIYLFNTPAIIHPDEREEYEDGLSILQRKANFILDHSFKKYFRLLRNKMKARPTMAILRILPSRGAQLSEKPDSNPDGLTFLLENGFPPENIQSHHSIYTFGDTYTQALNDFPHFLFHSRRALNNLKNKKEHELIDWYVDSMKLFNPKSDPERRAILIFLSDAIRHIAQNDKSQDIIDHFFVPIGLEETRILLPKYPSVLDSINLDLMSEHIPKDELIRKLINLLREHKKPGKPLTTLIAGGAGGGKSTLAAWIHEEAINMGLHSKYTGMDAYNFSRDERKKNGLEGLAMYQPDKIKELLQYLNKIAWRHGNDPGLKFRKVTDGKLGLNDYETEKTFIGHSDLFIFEGILTLAHAQLRETFDVGIYVHESDEKRFQRRLDRDQERKGYSPITIAWTFATTQRDEFPQIRDSAVHADYFIHYDKNKIYRRSFHSGRNPDKPNDRAGMGNLKVLVVMAIISLGVVLSLPHLGKLLNSSFTLSMVGLLMGGILNFRFITGWRRYQNGVKHELAARQHPTLHESYSSFFKDIQLIQTALLRHIHFEQFDSAKIALDTLLENVTTAFKDPVFLNRVKKDIAVQIYFFILLTRAYEIDEVAGIAVRRRIWRILENFNLPDVLTFMMLEAEPFMVKQGSLLAATHERSLKWAAKSISRWIKNHPSVPIYRHLEQRAHNIKSRASHVDDYDRNIDKLPPRQKNSAQMNIVTTNILAQYRQGYTDLFREINMPLILPFQTQNKKRLNKSKVSRKSYSTTLESILWGLGSLEEFKKMRALQIFFQMTSDENMNIFTDNSLPTERRDELADLLYENRVHWHDSIDRYVRAILLLSPRFIKRHAEKWDWENRRKLFGNILQSNTLDLIDKEEFQHLVDAYLIPEAERLFAQMPQSQEEYNDQISAENALLHAVEIYFRLSHPNIKFGGMARFDQTLKYAEFTQELEERFLWGDPNPESPVEIYNQAKQRLDSNPHLKGDGYKPIFRLSLLAMLRQMTLVAHIIKMAKNLDLLDKKDSYQFKFKRKNQLNTQQLKFIRDILGFAPDEYSAVATPVSIHFELDPNSYLKAEIIGSTGMGQEVEDLTPMNANLFKGSSSSLGFFNESFPSQLQEVRAQGLVTFEKSKSGRPPFSILLHELEHLLQYQLYFNHPFYRIALNSYSQFTNFVDTWEEKLVATGIRSPFLRFYLFSTINSQIKKYLMEYAAAYAENSGITTKSGSRFITHFESYFNYDDFLPEVFTEGVPDLITSFKLELKNELSSIVHEMAQHFERMQEMFLDEWAQEPEETKNISAPLRISRTVARFIQFSGIPFSHPSLLNRITTRLSQRFSDKKEGNSPAILLVVMAITSLALSLALPRYATFITPDTLMRLAPGIMGLIVGGIFYFSKGEEPPVPESEKAMPPPLWLENVLAPLSADPEHQIDTLVEFLIKNPSYISQGWKYVGETPQPRVGSVHILSQALVHPRINEFLTSNLRDGRRRFLKAMGFVARVVASPTSATSIAAARQFFNMGFDPWLKLTVPLVLNLDPQSPYLWIRSHGPGVKVQSLEQIQNYFDTHPDLGPFVFDDDLRASILNVQRHGVADIAANEFLNRTQLFGAVYDSIKQNPAAKGIDHGILGSMIHSSLRRSVEDHTMGLLVQNGVVTEGDLVDYSKFKFNEVMRAAVNEVTAHMRNILNLKPKQIEVRQIEKILNPQNDEDLERKKWLSHLSAQILGPVQNLAQQIQNLQPNSLNHNFMKLIQTGELNQRHYPVGLDYAYEQIMKNIGHRVVSLGTGSSFTITIQKRTLIQENNIDIVFLDNQLQKNIQQIYAGLNPKRQTYVILESDLPIDTQSPIGINKPNNVVILHGLFDSSQQQFQLLEIEKRLIELDSTITHKTANVIVNRDGPAFNFEGLHKSQSIFTRPGTIYIFLNNLLENIQIFQINLENRWREKLRALISA